MKKMIIYIAIILLPVAFIATGAQGLVVPDTIDFGIAPVGIIDNYPGLYTDDYPGIYDKEYTIKNNSQENIFIYHIDLVYDYPNYIRNLDNYFSLYNRVYENLTPELMISPGDSIKFFISYRSAFPDEISKTSYLKAGLTFKYHLENDLTPRYDTTELRVRSLAVDSLFISGAYWSTWSECLKEDKDNYWNLFFKIYNTTNTSYIIDSINYQINGNFEINGLFEELRKNNPIDLPYELKDSSVVFLSAKLYHTVQENKLIANVFCRNKETSEQKILRDSLVFIFNQPKSFLLQNGATWLVTYQGTTLFKEAHIRIIGCEGDSIVVDSLSVIGDLGLNEYNLIPYDGDFPKGIATGTFTRIASVQLTANEIGTWTGYVVGYFHDKSGEQFKRYASFKFSTLTPETSVNDGDFGDNKLIIYPNPANEFLNVYMNDQNSFSPATISIYNSIGEIVINIDSYENYTKIPIINLPNGIYFVIVNNGKEFVKGSFVISR